MASLGWPEKKLQDPRGLVWQLYAVAVCDCPLNCQSGGLIRLDEYLFPGNKCPHMVVKEVRSLADEQGFQFIMDQMHG